MCPAGRYRPAPGNSDVIHAHSRSKSTGGADTGASAAGALVRDGADAGAPTGVCAAGGCVLAAEHAASMATGRAERAMGRTTCKVTTQAADVELDQARRVTRQAG